MAMGLFQASATAVLDRGSVLRCAGRLGAVPPEPDRGLDHLRVRLSDRMRDDDVAECADRNAAARRRLLLLDPDARVESQCGADARVGVGELRLSESDPDTALALVGDAGV